LSFDNKKNNKLAEIRLPYSAVLPFQKAAKLTYTHLNFQFLMGKTPDPDYPGYATASS
jgi:hypothetical protein